MKDVRRWLCLDCSKNTFEDDADYYSVKDYLWRQLVAREQRHGMICRTCFERRLGRPLTNDDFKLAPFEWATSDDHPMDEADYAIYDSLAPHIVRTVDLAIIECVSVRPRKVSDIVGHLYEAPPPATPPLHDFFYLDRILALISDHALEVVTEGDNLHSQIVKAVVKVHQN